MSVYNVSGQALGVVYNAQGLALQTAYNRDGELIYPEFLDTATVTALPSISISGIKQGGCTDGIYIYQIVFDSNQYASGKFVKYKIADGTYTTTTFDGSVHFGHGNDMAYNPNNGHLYVCTMESDGAVIELTTDFEYVSTHYALSKSGSPYKVWQFAFDRKTNHFISANSNGMSVYDENWNHLSWFPMPTHPDATAQGCETDGEYVYRITWNPNYIDVAAMGSGEYIKTITLQVSGEPESIMYNWTTGEYYISRNVASGLFSIVRLKA